MRVFGIWTKACPFLSLLTQWEGNSLQTGIADIQGSLPLAPRGLPSQKRQDVSIFHSVPGYLLLRLSFQCVPKIHEAKGGSRRRQHRRTPNKPPCINEFKYTCILRTITSGDNQGLNEQLLNKQEKRDLRGTAEKPWESFRICGNSLGWRSWWAPLFMAPTLRWGGWELSGYFDQPARLCNVFSTILPRAFCLRTKGATRNNKASWTWHPYWKLLQPSRLVSQEL